MSSQEITIILSASLVGLIYLLIIRRFDIYEKEPFYKLLLVAIIGGAISVITSLFIYDFIDIKHTFSDAILKIGPIEEFSKLIALLIVYNFIKKDFNEIVDGLIYIAAIALGFSIIENIFYAFRSTEPFLILFQRSIFSVVGHISFSGYLGVAFYIHTKIQRNYFGIILALLIASFAHGLYDAFIFQKELNGLFRFVFYGLIFLQFLLFKVVLGFSKFRPPLSLEIFNTTDRTIFLKCCKCNSSIKDKALRFWKINAAICGSCNSIVIQGENVGALFKYFRPALKIQKYFKSLSKDKKVKYLDDKEQIYYNWQRTILSASIPELSDWLAEANKQDRKKILEIPFIGDLLYYIGLKHIQDD